MDSRRTALTFGKRLAIALVLLAAIMYGVLALAERNPDAIRQGLQDYLGQATGHLARIDTMPKAELTPSVMFAMEGLYIFDKEKADRTLAAADKLYVATPLRNMVFGVPQYYGFEIHGLRLATGFPLPRLVAADFAGISDPSPDRAAAQFVVEGRYGSEPLLLTAELARKVTRRGLLYRFGDDFPFTAKFGAVEADGRFVRGFNSVGLEKITMSTGAGSARMDITDLHAGDDGTGSGKITGDVAGTPFTGSIDKADGRIAIVISPAAEDKQLAAAVRAFFTGLTKELGLDQPESRITIRFAGDQTQ